MLEDVKRASLSRTFPQCSNSCTELRGQVVESFIDFIPFQRKTAKDITQTILQKLNDDGLPIENCRGQGYDNAATMAGIHMGVQQQIRNVNPKAEFVACANHTLNLAGVHSAGVSVPLLDHFL